jgi:hypothetical protein
MPVGQRMEDSSALLGPQMRAYGRDHHLQALRKDFTWCVNCQLLLASQRILSLRALYLKSCCNKSIWVCPQVVVLSLRLVWPGAGWSLPGAARSSEESPRIARTHARLTHASFTEKLVWPSLALSKRPEEGRGGGVTMMMMRRMRSTRS